MQSARWYVRRLRAMTMAEAAERALAMVRDAADRRLLPYRRLRAGAQVAVDGRVARCGGLNVSEVAVGAWAAGGAGALRSGWARRLQERADRIAAGRVRVFDQEDCGLGDPIDWNRDPKHGLAAPLRYAPTIDYRDFRVTGDAKFVWEPNRHQHLVVLGRAYRASGQVRYAEAALRQWEQWLEQCPFGMGMNWRSPLEFGVRLINWVWALDLLRPSGLIQPEFYRRLLEAVYLQVWEIARKYSRGSSANNHRIGEAAGVFIACCYFQELRDTQRWRERAREILSEEILRQTYADGGTREQALGYHVFALQFFVLAGLAARAIGREFPAGYWERLRRMFAFLATFCEAGPPPMFGDYDDGYVLDVDGEPLDVRPWLAVGAVLFAESWWRLLAGGAPESVEWLPLRDAAAAWQRMSVGPRRLTTQALPDSGYYLLQHGAVGALDAVSVAFDCGELGYGALAAHGHADALSFTLRAFGGDVLVDPGTYDYFTHPRWREYFRSTRAHNTIVVDGVDQSEMLGPFLWGRRAHARCLAFEPNADGGRVCGEHDGYRRLPDPVLHRRALVLAGPRRELCIEDELIARGEHLYELHLHLAETCRVTARQGNGFEIDAGTGRLTLELAEGLSVETLAGSVHPIGGWVSRGYHCKAPGVTLVGKIRHRGMLRLRTRIRVGSPTPRAPARGPEPACSAAG